MPDPFRAQPPLQPRAGPRLASLALSFAAFLSCALQTGANDIGYPDLQILAIDPLPTAASPVPFDFAKTFPEGPQQCAATCNQIAFDTQCTTLRCLCISRAFIIGYSSCVIVACGQTLGLQFEDNLISACKGQGVTIVRPPIATIIPGTTFTVGIPRPPSSTTSLSNTATPSRTSNAPAPPISPVSSPTSPSATAAETNFESSTSRASSLAPSGSIPPLGTSPSLSTIPATTQLSGGAIAGLALGSTVAALAFGIAGYLYLRRRKIRNLYGSSSTTSSPSLDSTLRNTDSKLNSFKFVPSSKGLWGYLKGRTPLPLPRPLLSRGKPVGATPYHSSNEKLGGNPNIGRFGLKDGGAILAHTPSRPQTRNGAGTLGSQSKRTIAPATNMNPKDAQLYNMYMNARAPHLSFRPNEPFSVRYPQVNAHAGSAAGNTVSTAQDTLDSSASPLSVLQAPTARPPHPDPLSPPPPVRPISGFRQPFPVLAAPESSAHPLQVPPRLVPLHNPQPGHPHMDLPSNSGGRASSTPLPNNRHRSTFVGPGIPPMDMQIGSQ